jgi:hypothetical protein
LLRPIVLLSALLLALATVVPRGATAAATAAPRTVVIVAASHARGGGLHDHAATARLLTDLLRKARTTPAVRAVVMDEKAARAEHALDGAHSVVLLGDEGQAHLLNDPALRANVAAVIARHRGLVLVHGSAAPPAELEGEVRQWVGALAHSETTIASVNWPAGFGELTDHPVLKGLTPFSVNDRWLPAQEKTVTGASRLLRAEPPEYAQIEGRPAEQTMAWAYERPEGGRSFVYGGGHFFESYRSEDLRRLLVNAVLWTAQVEGEAVISK